MVIHINVWMAFVTGEGNRMRMFRKVFACIVAFVMVLSMGDFGALAATLTLPASTKTDRHYIPI